MKFSLLALLVPILSCGYHAGPITDTRDVAVVIVENSSEWRRQEFDLSAAISRELLAAGIHVNAASSTHELRGEIRDYARPSLVVDERDTPIVGSVSVGLHLKLIDRRTGAVVREAERTEQASYARARSESPESARREVFARLARWSVTMLETSW